MILTGLADESAGDIDGQIRAHKELGWNAIELRLIDKQNVCGEQPADAFERSIATIEAAGMSVPAFGSAIGNWSRPITGDFQIDVDDLKQTIPRMQRCGAQYLRTMTWLQDTTDEKTWRDEAIRRYRELARIAEDGGIYLAHENCTGWAGTSGETMRELIETVDSPNVVILYDIGNVVGHGADPWSFYEPLKDLIRYIHIKDGKYEAGGSFHAEYCGEGEARVHDVLVDQFKRGYDGVVSIEPHVTTQVHVADRNPDPQEMYDSYVRYGRMAIELVESARSAATA